MAGYSCKTIPVAGSNKTVCLYGPEAPAAQSLPLVYCDLFDDQESEWLLGAVEEQGLLSRCHLVTVSGFEWNRELSPWPAERVFKQDKDFDGEGDAYLAELLEKIRPAVLAALAEQDGDGARAPAYEAIAGYSMAGMFSVYAVTKTDVFSRLMSASGSMWFPDFTEYLTAWDPAVSGRLPDKAYFSLGSKERKVRNPLTSQVQAKTEEVEALFAARGAKTTFVLEPGNHFVDIGGRIARGIAWMLED